MKQSAALRVSLTEDPVVEDADAFDCEDCSIYGAPENDVIDLIEEERCPLADPQSSDGLHVYLDGQNHCARCATLAPWVRRDQCRAA